MNALKIYFRFYKTILLLEYRNPIGFLFEFQIKLFPPYFNYTVFFFLYSVNHKIHHKFNVFWNIKYHFQPLVSHNFHILFRKWKGFLQLLLENGWSRNPVLKMLLNIKTKSKLMHIRIIYFVFLYTSISHHRGICIRIRNQIIITLVTYPSYFLFKQMQNFFKFILFDRIKNLFSTFNNNLYGCSHYYIEANEFLFRIICILQCCQ